MRTDTDWSLYRSFLAVAEEGSLIGAARALGAHQPTLGRHVASLEAALGVSLFERTPRGLVLTPAARTLLPRAQALRAEAEAIARLALSDTTAMDGTVRISASEIVAAYLLPPLLAPFAQSHPGIAIELVATNEVSNLVAREADIAIRMLRPRQAGLIARKIGEIPVGIYAARGLVARYGLPRSLEDLRGLRLVGYDRSTLILKGARARGFRLKRSDFAFRSDNHVACWHAVKAGLGAGFIARPVGDGDSDVMRVLPKLSFAPMPVWLCSHRDLRSSLRIRALFDHVAGAMGRLLHLRGGGA